MQEFKNQNQLRNFLDKILKNQVKTLQQENFSITSDELFQDLIETKWKDAEDLHLYEIVDDILHFKPNKK